MNREKILARLNLNAVLPLLEEVVAEDAEARELVRGWNAVIQFSVIGGPAAHLVFTDGRLEVREGRYRWPTVAFSFTSAAALNKMFSGEGFVIPLVWKGWWHPVMLVRFTKLTKRLDAYMKADYSEGAVGQASQGTEAFDLAVRLFLYAAIYGIKEVGENDPDMSQIIAALPDGTAEMRVLPDGPVAHVSVRNGRFSPVRGKATGASVYMEFRDARVAMELFQGRLDAMAAIGRCDIVLRGLIPLVDGLSAIMDRLGTYFD